MRPVKPARTSANGRAGNRRRDADARAGGREERGPGFFGRLFAPFAALFSFRHPVFFLSFILASFVAVFALLVSGVVGRAVRHVETAVDMAAAQAGFAIGTVAVTGNAHTPRAAILAQLDAGRSIFTVSPLDTRLRLRHMDWVRDAVVRRHYPGEIDITIVERKPYALWQQSEGGRTILIDREGERITAQNIDKFYGLPFLIGDGAPAAGPEFVDAVRQRPNIARHVKAYRYHSGRRWDLLLTEGVVVKFPEYGWRKQLDDLDRLIAKNGVLGYDAGEIDLRSDSFYIFGQVPNVKTEEKKPEEGRAI